MLTFDLMWDVWVFWHGFVFGPQLFRSIDVVLSYLTQEYITLGRCVTKMHNLCMTFTFGLNNKIILSPWICVWACSSLLFDTGIPNLAHGCTCIIIRQHVVYIHDLSITLTYNLRGWRGILRYSFTHGFYLLFFQPSVSALGSCPA